MPTRQLHRELQFQFAVNQILLDRGIRTAGTGSLLTQEELDDMQRACHFGNSPAEFVEYLVAKSATEHAA